MPTFLGPIIRLDIRGVNVGRRWGVNIPRRLTRNRRITVTEGHVGAANLSVTADARSWLRFLAGEMSILRCLATGAVRLKGSPRLLTAFGKCFPS
jgi:hypothetical protein